MSSSPTRRPEYVPTHTFTPASTSDTSSVPDTTYGNTSTNTSTNTNTDAVAEIFSHLEAAAKLAEAELDSDLQANHIHTKSWHIRKAAEAAEIAGWPKQQIATKLWALVEKNNFNISRRLIQLVCQPLGYVNEEFAHPKAKSEKDENGETIAPKNSSAPNEHETENAEIITLFEALIAAYESKIDKLKSQPFVSKLNQSEKEELVYLLRKCLENTNDEWDGRQDVSEREHFILYTAAALPSLERATELYITKVKDFFELSGKQYTKLARGRATICHPILEPKNVLEAVRAGFYGQQCPKCASWRVEPTPELGKDYRVRCFACHNVFEPESKAFPASERVQLDKKIDETIDLWRKVNQY